MKKIVVELEIHDEKAKQKAMKLVSGLSGVESIQVELKDKKMTVVGDIDPVSVVRKLRKFRAKIVSVVPATEENKACWEMIFFFIDLGRSLGFLAS